MIFFIHLKHTAQLFSLSSCSVVSNSATPCSIADQAPLSIEFSRQEYWSGLPFPSPGYLPDPGIENTSPVLTGGFFITEPPLSLQNAILLVYSQGWATITTIKKKPCTYYQPISPQHLKPRQPLIHFMSLSICLFWKFFINEVGNMGLIHTL